MAKYEYTYLYRDNDNYSYISGINTLADLGWRMVGSNNKFIYFERALPPVETL